jgi:hypothetical protein
MVILQRDVVPNGETANSIKVYVNHAQGMSDEDEQDGTRPNILKATKTKTETNDSIPLFLEQSVRGVASHVLFLQTECKPRNHSTLYFFMH